MMGEEKHIQLKNTRIPPLLLFLPYVRTICTGYRYRTVCETVWREQCTGGEPGFQFQCRSRGSGLCDYQRQSHNPSGFSVRSYPFLGAEEDVPDQCPFGRGAEPGK